MGRPCRADAWLAGGTRAGARVCTHRARTYLIVLANQLPATTRPSFVRIRSFPTWRSAFTLHLLLALASRSSRSASKPRAMSCPPAHLAPGPGEHASVSFAQPRERTGSKPPGSRPPPPQPSQRSSVAPTRSGPNGDVPFVTKPSTFVGNGHIPPDFEELLRANGNGSKQHFQEPLAGPRAHADYLGNLGVARSHPPGAIRPIPTRPAAAPAAARTAANAALRTSVNERIPEFSDDAVLQLAMHAERLAAYVRAQRQQRPANGAKSTEALASGPADGSTPAKPNGGLSIEPPTSSHAASDVARHMKKTGVPVTRAKSRKESWSVVPAPDAARELPTGQAPASTDGPKQGQAPASATEIKHPEEKRDHPGEAAQRTSETDNGTGALPRTSQRDWLTRQETEASRHDEEEDEKEKADSAASFKSAAASPYSSDAISPEGEKSGVRLDKTVSELGEPLMKLRKHDGSSAGWGSLRFAGHMRPPAKWCAVACDSNAKDVIGCVAETSTASCTPHGWDAGPLSAPLRSAFAARCFCAGCF